MSIRSLGTRSAILGLGLFASLALMAGPSWAAEGGNSANAELCQQELGVLVAQDGGSFKNEGACTSYAAKGGVLTKGEANLEVRLQFEAPHCLSIHFFPACISFGVVGFGLKPGSFVEAGFKGYQERLLPVNALGVIDTGQVGAILCPFLAVGFGEGTLASGKPIKAVVTGPSGC